MTSESGNSTSSASKVRDDTTCPALQLHQEVVAFLLRPPSPVTRLLVDQPTGAGKTREIITVLDQYFYDRRVKVPIFPKAAVCRNFYEELLRWPSRYRDFYSFLRPTQAAWCAGVSAAAPAGDWQKHRTSRWP